MIEKVASSAARFSTTLLYFSSVPVCQAAYLPQVMIAIHTGIFFPGFFLQEKVTLFHFDLTKDNCADLQKLLKINVRCLDKIQEKRCLDKIQEK